MVKAYTVRVLLAEAVDQLNAAGIDSAQREAECLLEDLLGKSRLDLYLQEEEVTADQVAIFQDRIQQRATGWPLQYIQGQASFMGENFKVRPGVFIPRPETEQLVETVLGLLRPMADEGENPLKVLDLGTGSGAIAVSLAKYLPSCLVLGIDVSYVAISQAKENAVNLGVSSRVSFLQGTWAESLTGPVDALISNPPYIPEAQLASLPREVQHEPTRSLISGAEGLDDLCQLISEGPRLLRDGGIMAFECGEEQVEPMLKYCRSLFWVSESQSFSDLVQRPRGFWLRKGISA